MRRFRRILFVLALIALAMWWFLPNPGPRIQPGSALALELSGEYVEAAEPPLLARLLGDGRHSFIALLSELRKAERDERLAVVVLRIRDLEIGWAKAQELRAAIQALRSSGRRVIAYLETSKLGANVEYYVAVAADEVRTAPSTRSPMIGLAAEYVFLGGLWEKLGVGVEVERVGEYKGAAETLAERKMSEPNREMANSLLDSIDGQFVAGIAEGRRLEPAAVRRAIDEAPISPEQLKQLGLIDQIQFWDELADELGGKDKLVDAADYARVDPKMVGFLPTTRFALIYGSGNVVVGRGTASRSGSPIFASDTLTEALAEASQDDAIQAIILRIDSPGGSPLAADQIWRAARQARAQGKPLIVSCSDLAASAAYYVAAGADAIVAQPGSLTGSIGVFVLRPVLRGLLEKLDIGVESLTRGSYASLLLASEPLTERTRGWLHAEVASIYDLFLSRVAEGRDLSIEQVDAVARGRVWTGEQAAGNGLVDEIGGLRVAVRRALQQLKLNPDSDVALVPYPAPVSLAEQLDETLHNLTAGADPLGQLLRRAEPWLEAIEAGAPALLPPFIPIIR
ncbi:MAG TPA: signal peptide peptidase SppA [Myxococcota bacterium]|jgi:protease-4